MAYKLIFKDFIARNSLFDTIVNDGWIPNKKKNSRNSKQITFQKGGRTILYYNNPQKEIWVDSDNKQTKGSIIDYLREFDIASTPKELEEWEEHNGDYIPTEYKKPDTLPSVTSPVIFKGQATKTLAQTNYLTQRLIPYGLLKKYTKYFVAESKKKFKETNNIIFPLYHLDKTTKELSEQGQLVRNHNFKNVAKDSQKAISLWLNSYNNHAENLYIFEDSINALSFEYLKLNKTPDIYYRLAAFAGNPAKFQIIELLKHLSTNSSFDSLHICMDNDLAGANISFEIISKLFDYFDIGDFKFFLRKDSPKSYFTLRLKDTYKTQFEAYFPEANFNSYSLEYNFYIENDTEALYDTILAIITLFFTATRIMVHIHRSTLNDWNDDLIAILTEKQLT